MAVEVKVPAFGDSVSEVMIGEWHKKVGEVVQLDEGLVEVESDKATQDINSPVRGVLLKLLKQPGDTATVGEVVAILDETAAGAENGAKPAAQPPAAQEAAKPSSAEPRVVPAAQRVLNERGLSPDDVTATGPGGRILKEDVQRHASPPAAAAASQPASPPPAPITVSPEPTTVARVTGERSARRQSMSLIRRRIAQRLLEAQQNAALLTTFNEVDMSAVMELRKQHQEAFVEKHGVKLGFMSFFVKASVEALLEFPAINAEISGNDIIYHDYCDVGIAIGGGKGLVVPVLRSAEAMTFSEIEKAIGDFAKRAQANQLTPQELTGGTFTISNGGVYGSMLSTPIVNPPQSAVLGMHSIQERAIVRNGQIVARPMMYLALTYDHRIVDGREAVTFLKRIKDCIENPVRLLLEV